MFNLLLEVLNVVLMLSLAYNTFKQCSMQENQIRKLTKDATFFQPSRFRKFDDDIASLKVKLRPNAIQQLSLKTYGYGYFENKQTEMKENFRHYLKQAIIECTGLKGLKIEFNGYSIKDKTLLNIISIIEDLLQIEGREIQTIWIHTRLLRDCEIEMIKEMLSLADMLISKKKFQEISLQIAGWEFTKGPLTYKQFIELFSGFAGNIMLMGEHNLKRLRLDLSALYMSDLQSYNFLRESVPYDILVESIENQRFNQRNNDNQKRPPPPQSRLSENRDQIRKYLKLIDSKYAIEHPIPGKTNFISREPQYQKRKKEYIYQMKQRCTKEELLKVFLEERGMGDEHQKVLKRIKNQVDAEMDEQAKRIQEDDDLKEQTNEIQCRIGDKFIKFPFDYVMAQRVQKFHKQIKAFVNELVQRLGKLQEFELDMCNWNGNFQMGQLKKMLTKEFSQGGVRPNLNQGSKIAQRNNIPAEEEGSKLKCKFIM